MALYIVAAKKTTLKSPLAAADTSVVLKEFVDRDGNALAMASFGEFGTIVIKQGEVWELIKFTGITQNADNATLTVASSGRSLLPISPYTGASTGEDFSAGAEVVVTNDPYIMAQFANLENENTFAERQTFTVTPRSNGGSPLTSTDLATKAYVDTAVLGTLTTINVIVPGTAGATIAAGDLIYYDDSTNTWKLCDADTAATVNNVMLGIAQGAGTNGVAITNGVLLQGVDANQSGLTEGQTYYASNTAGDISSSAGTNEVTVGIGKSATELYFAPRFDQMITEYQQDILDAMAAGTYGYAADTAASDDYTIAPTPAITAYATGMRFRFKAVTANTGAATLAVNGLAAKTIKKMNDQDLGTGDIEAGAIVEVVYDGTNFQMVSQLSKQPSALDYQAFTASGTWTKPTGLSGDELVLVHLWGAGGGGGGTDGQGAASDNGGAGGGGGGFSKEIFKASQLGATETVTIGAGGNGGAAGDFDGTAGGNSTFGTHLTAYGGGFGEGTNGPGGTNSGGGGGGGFKSVGANGSSNGTGGAGGGYGGGTAGAEPTDIWGGGGGGGTGSGGGAAYYGGGGGAGGNTSDAASAGGASIWGGGGGGGGTSGAGGTSKYAGAGGAAGTNGNGVDGSAPAGGGGGGSSDDNTNYAGGAGARGECRVWVIR